MQSVVDDKEQVNALSTKDLRNLFKFRSGTPSDTHDKLRCERCKIIQDNAELEAKQVLPKKLAACLELVKQMMEHDDAHYFHKALQAPDHGVSKEAYEKVVKQPMDLGTIKSRLEMSQDLPSSYKSVSSVPKDVNRIFSNVMKAWAPGDDIADAARRLQTWWVEQWTELVPRLMVMKAEEELSGGSDDAEEAGILGTCSTINNERGEDYQEQIGMPDEENMRSWSHHHSTDTVDDPVFRAAMRGYDSVSFVFGLEVTWSLIQQRQQEEEERQAMQELEEIQELAESERAEAEDSKADLEENDESSSEDEDESDRECGTSDKVMTDGASEQEATEMAGSESDESSISLELHSSEGRGEREARQALVVGKPESAESVVEVFSASQADTSLSDKENDLPSPSRNEWECSACTLFNKQSNRKCEACGSKRPKAGAKRSIDELSR